VESVGSADDVTEVEGGVALVDEVPIELLELRDESLVLLLQMEALDRTAQRQAHVVARPGLAEVPVEEAVVDRLAERRHIRVAGDEDVDRIGTHVLRGGEELKPRHPRHLLVGDDDGNGLLAQDLQSLRAALREEQRVIPSEVEAEDVEVVALVVDHENGVLRGVDRGRLHEAPKSMTKTVMDSRRVGVGKASRKACLRAGALVG
jgi:hypothetical protein